MILLQLFVRYLLILFCLWFLQHRHVMVSMSFAGPFPSPVLVAIG